MTERELPYAIYSFSQHILIKNIFIHELGAGDVGVLCGKPGCGKSTLIYQLGKNFPGRVVVFTATGLSGFCQLTHTACTHGKLQPDWRDVRISRFWSTLMPALSSAAQPIIIVIDNADALARHLPAFVDNFRHLAASFDAGASLLLVGGEALRRNRGLKRRITLSAIIAAPTDDEYLDFMHQQQLREADGEPVRMRHEFVRKAVRAVQGNLALLRRIARAARKMATDRQADVLTAQQERLLLETFTLRSCVLRKGILPGLYAALALTFGWLAVDVFPLQLPVPAGLTVAMTQKKENLPDIGDARGGLRDAMQQLFSVWGFDTAHDEAWCDQADRAELVCESGKERLDNLIRRGLPWIAHLNINKQPVYGVVMRVSGNELDLIIDNKTWIVSQEWLAKHWQGNYTLMLNLTPDRKMQIGEKSPAETIIWFDTMLSRALGVPGDKSGSWTPWLIEKVKAFQQRENLPVDGKPGKETLIRLRQSLGDAPVLINEAAPVLTHVSSKERV
ncbi:AAA family ATPase [Citrobacter braakii]|uniref:AAA family ATPase n=1 Tax=Citrobacter braakii TaxID=57706 RepID=UPI001BCFCECD|nr:AAA family ATPase [Citrobacter braakii]